MNSFYLFIQTVCEIPNTSACKRISCGIMLSSKGLPEKDE